MAAVGDDCYFYYYSSCAKGSQCLYRHCEAARANETTCSLWRAGACFRPNCRFRHMEIQVDRSQVPCYWENQPVGCSKPHCVFKHFKPRPGSVQPPTTTTGEGTQPAVSVAPSAEAEEVQQNISSGHSSPIVQPVIIPMEDSDVESTGTVSNAGTPLKLKPRSDSVSPVRKVDSGVVKRSGVETSDARPQKSPTELQKSPSRREECSHSSRSYPYPPPRSPSPPPSRRQVSPPPRHRVSPRPVSDDDGYDARSSPVRSRKPVTERLGARNAASDSLSKQPAVASLKPSKPEKSAVEPLSLEEIYRQRALESMLKAREQSAAARPKPEESVEHEDSQFDCRRVELDSQCCMLFPADLQVDCRRVVVDSEDPEELEPSAQSPSPNKARISVRERLGVKVSPKKALWTNKRKHQAEEASEEERVRAPLKKRKLPPAARLGEAGDIKPIPAPLRRRKPHTAPQLEEASDDEPIHAPPRKRKYVAAAVSEEEDDDSEEEIVHVPLRKHRSGSASDPENDSDVEPAPAPVRKRKRVPLKEPEVISEDEPVTVTVRRRPEGLEPVKITFTQETRPVKRKLADRLGTRLAEENRLTKKIIGSVLGGKVKPRRLKIKSAESDTASPATLKSLKKTKTAVVQPRKLSSDSATELRQPVDEDLAVEEKQPKKQIVMDALAERKRLKKLMADHVRSSAVEKPRRKITLVADQEEERVSQSPKVLSLEEIRRRKQLKQQTTEETPPASESDKPKSAVPDLSLSENRRRQQEKEARPQPVYDISLFTDRPEAKSTSTKEQTQVLSLEEIRARKLKLQKRQPDDQSSEVPDLTSIRSASKKVTPAPARRSKAEMQIYVPPARKNAVKADSASPLKKRLGETVPLTKEVPAVKKRLGEAVPLTKEVPAVKKRLGKALPLTKEVPAVKKRLGEALPLSKAQAEDKQDGGSVGVKTFSEIMAEKRRKRQLEKEQQQKSKQREQHRNGSGEASKKAFRFQPVKFGDSDGDSNSPKRPAAASFSRATENASANLSARLTKDAAQHSLSDSSQVTSRFSVGGDDLTLKKDAVSASVTKISNSSVVRTTGWGKQTAALKASEDPQSSASCPLSSDSVPKPHSSSAPFISARAQPSLTPVSLVSQPRAPTPQQKVVTPVTATAKLSSPVQPARGSVASTAPSLTTPSAIEHQSPSGGKSKATEFRRASSHLSTSRLLSETQDELLLGEEDAVTLDDADQLDDLLMDIDSLLE